MRACISERTSLFVRGGETMTGGDGGDGGAGGGSISTEKVSTATVSTVTVSTHTAGAAVEVSGGWKPSLLPVTDWTKAIVCAISASRSLIHFMGHLCWGYFSKAGRPNQEGNREGIAYFSRPPDSGAWTPRQTGRTKRRA